MATNPREHGVASIWRRFCVCIVAFTLSAIVAGGSPVAADEDAYRSLVNELGHEEYQIRESATKKLIEAGLPAAKAVESGARHPDREIRYRCLRILRMIRENDLRLRLAAFVKGDSDGELLPSWQLFQKLLGDEASTRQLFAQMVKSEPDLLRAIDAGAATSENILDLRTRSLETAVRFYRQELSTGSIAALLFAAGDEQVEVSTNATSAIHRFCLEHGFSATPADGPEKNSMRKLLGRWIRRAEGWPAYRAMELARKFKLADGLVPAENIIRSNEQQTNAKVYAVLTIAKLGGPKHIPLLKTLLDDPTVCSTQRLVRNNRQIQLQGQIRDVALAALLYMHDLDPLAFGFDRELTRDQTNVFQVGTMAFLSDEERDAAFKKWREFDKKDPGK